MTVETATERIHKAAPGGDGFHCTTCGQPVKRVTGGQGPTWVHADTGAVAAPNPPILSHEPVIMRRMDALKAAIQDRHSAPHRQQHDIEFAYDQVLRALTKAFES